MTILDAKTRLEAEGLYVSCNNAHSLWIAATVRDVGEGIKISQDACSLLWKAERWIAVFPTEGLRTYEIPGTLPELVALVTAVYASYRREGGRLEEALRQNVNEAEQYLVGRSIPSCSASSA